MRKDVAPSRSDAMSTGQPESARPEQKPPARKAACGDTERRPLMRKLDRFILRRLLERFTLVLLFVVCMLALGGYALADTSAAADADSARPAVTPTTAMHPGLPH
jgi:hypothetical protein